MMIFIIEDDKDIAEAIAGELKGWGFQTKIAEDFNRILEEVLSAEANLVLMDIGLPYFNGFYWTSKLREVSKVPIMFISSRGEDTDIISAMQFGGDDYIVKPINLPVLVAKVKALLRRSYEFSEEVDFLEYKGVKLLISDVSLEYRGEKVSLTKTELLILEVLFKDRGAVSKRDVIIDRCWQEDSFIDDNTLAVNMTRLRKKLAGFGLQDFIATKKGVGYFLNEV